MRPLGVRRLLGALVVALLLTATVAVPAQAQALAVQVDGAGQSILLDVEPSDSIENVKAKVQDAAGFAPAAQRLFYEFMELRDDRTLADYDIRKNAVLQVFLTGAAPTFVRQTGGPGAPTRVGNTSGVATDAASNVYVTEWEANRVQKFDKDGNFITRWGTPGSGNGQFNRPRGIAVDSVGNVYVADASNNRIQKFNSAGTFLGKWGSSGTATGQFNQPYGVAVDTDDNVYVVDANNARVQKFTSAGVFLLAFPIPPSVPGGSSLPRELAVDRAGSIYVSDLIVDSPVQKFNNVGTVVGKLTLRATPGAGSARTGSVAVDSAGRVNVVDLVGGKVQVFDRAGNFLSSWGTAGTAPGQLDRPAALAVDAEGYLWVTDSSTTRVQRFAYAPDSLAAPTATPGDGSATVTVAPRTAGGPVTRYTVTSIPGTRTCTVAASASPVSCQVTGLVNDAPYQFVVSATGPGGNSAPSPASDVVSPVAVPKIPVTITADRLVKTYGDADPTLTFAVTGLVDGDQLLAPPTCIRASGDGVGTRAVTCTGAQADPKYSLSYVAGALEIRQRPITVTPQGQSRVYGADLPASYPYDVTSGSLVGADAITGSCNVVGSPVNAGTYPITCPGLSAGPNYDLTVGAADLVITKKPGAVVPDSVTITYGDAEPQLTFTVTGLRGNDSLRTPPTCAVPPVRAGERRAAGEYPITCANGADPNYDVDQTRTATLTVVSRQVDVAVANATATYGAGDPEFTRTISGLLSGDELTSAGTCGVVGLHRNVGEYPITCMGVDAGANYRVVATPGTFKVTQAPLRLTADDKVRAPGAANPVFTFSASGLVNSDSLRDAVTGAPAFSTTADADAPPGAYPIVMSRGSLRSTNYDLTLVAGTLTVEQRVLTVTASSGASVFGTPTGAVSPTYSGFLPGDGPADLEVAPICSNPATVSSNVGTYATTCAGGSDERYSFAYLPGTWRVDRSPVVIAPAATPGLTNLLTLRTGFAATVRHATTGAPVVGTQVTFALTATGKAQCTATTDANGLAQCRVGNLNLGTPYVATSSQTGNYLPGRGTGTVRYLF
ncbi:MAG: cell surface protein [Marmoricola sp.]|nr:cell surface protein [Marmoricola sp.]